MSILSRDAEDEYEPAADFTAGPFVTRRDPPPIKDLISTFSELYLNSDNENESDVQPDIPLPPPPPPDDIAPDFSPTEQFSHGLAERVTALEGEVQTCLQKLSQCCSQTEFSSQCKLLEERLNYKIQRECERVKQGLELSIQDLGKSMVDCLKRRDTQIDAKIKSYAHVVSTPVSPPFSAPAHHARSNQIASLPDNVNDIFYRPPIKAEFPQFDSDDPVSFIERCEEYFAIRPLTDSEILASLTSVLKGTAKDWWLAERRHVLTWEQFKQEFLHAFLTDDYEAEATKRLLERKQGSRESIRDFAYHYRALCLRWKKEMTEKEIVQAILRNCNPRLASLLRGNVKEVSELVRTGTQIERDFEEAKRYWSQVNVETQKRKSPLERDSQSKLNPSSTRILQPMMSEYNLKTLTLPLLVRGRYFQALVDTGSSLTLIQESCWRKLGHKEQLKSSGGQTFKQANGQVLHAIGVWCCECELHGRMYEVELFVMKDDDLTVPMVLGMDFLVITGIHLDIGNALYTLPAITDYQEETFSFLTPLVKDALLSLFIALPIPEETTETRQYIQQLITNADISSVFRSQLHHLLQEWPTVCTSEIGHTSVVSHRIITTNEVPVRKKAYRVSQEKQAFIEQEIKSMLDKKIIQPSFSSWAAPVVLVPKKGGGQRFCIDYRGLNAKTYLDGYPMPQIHDILESVHGAAVFSTLDLKSGYWQVEVDPESIHKTAFVTQSGLYEFLRLPFGLKNSAASFQRLMEFVLKDQKGKNCFVYIDDIVVYSTSEQEHLNHLREVLQCLHKAGLTLNLQKCNLMQKSLKFLGHVLSVEGIKTDEDKVKAVNDFPVPKSLKEVQRFLGMAGWYQRFIPKFSEKVASLHALKKKGATWRWTEECQNSFELIKRELISAPILIAPDLNKPFKVQTDASDLGVGAVLTQDIAGVEHVIAYASRLLRGAEKSYSVSEKECCAVVWAIEKWRPYLEGRPFEVITDHAALTWVFNHPKPSSRLIRWGIRLQEFEFTVKYRKGQCNIVPDTLSRSFTESSSLNLLTPLNPKDSSTTFAAFPIEWSDIAKAQQDDAETQKLIAEIQSTPSPDPKRIHYVMKNGFLFRSISQGHKGEKLQLVIPSSLRADFLNYAHDNPLSGHLGRLKTLLRLVDICYWPMIRADVWKHCKECQVCQKYKPSVSKLAGHMQSTPIVEPGYMLGIDLMGPFPRSSKQNEHLLVIVDYCSKWVELFPLRVAKAPQISRILVEEVFTRWGTPRYLVSDRGTQFTSQLINLICKQWNVIQKLTTAAHPQTNLTERVNRTLKTMIASYVRDHHRHWDKWLAEFRFAINTAWQESTGFTPAEVMLGRKLKGPLERAIMRPPDPNSPAYPVLEKAQELIQSVQRNVERAQSKQRKYYNLRRRQVHFRIGDLVWVRTHPLSRADEGFMAKLAAKWKGPAKVVKCLGPVNYMVSFMEHPENADTFHVQNLKPYFGNVGKV